MRLKTIFFTCLLSTGSILHSQILDDFYYVEPETKNLPVLVRGNLEARNILLFIQGGDADNGIDFGRSDYPRWKNTLESSVAIAYFDRRGLNRSVNKIDTSKVNGRQQLKDIIAIASSLKEKYKADIHLFGHSLGGVNALNCLALYSEASAFVKSGIIINTPITTDFSPERYTHYRPLYLKNLSKEFVEQGKDEIYWQQAYDWMVKTDSISNIEDSKLWNTYVDNAFSPVKRRIGMGMVLKTIFAKPYNPIKYLNNKDNEYVGDKLWYDEKNKWEAGKQTVLWEVLPNIRKPILLITGRYDAIATPEEQVAAHDLIKDSELLVLPNCAHQSFIDQPKLFNEAILNYLNL